MGEMRVLLLEEYSGFFKNLKEGLKTNGHDVTFIATQDGWKKVEGMDYIIGSSFKGVLAKIVRRFKLLWHLPKMRGYDVVFLINQSFLFEGISSLVLWYLKYNNKKVFLSACGGDVQYARFGLSGGYRYWPYDGFEGEVTDKCLSKHDIRLNRKVCNSVNGVIPITYEYAEAWRNSPHKHLLLKTIPLPINVDSVKPASFVCQDKIVFFHGLNREGFKGTLYIREAMENMAKKYPSEIEIIIKGKMPLNEYLDLLRDVNVVIDSCKGYSYANMNTLYAMALGKTVMMTCESECIAEYGLEDRPPIVAISPNVRHIEEQIEWIILNREKLKKISCESRSFVEEYHSHKLIAQRYTDQWTKIPCG